MQNENDVESLHLDREATAPQDASKEVEETAESESSSETNQEDKGESTKESETLESEDEADDESTESEETEEQEDGAQFDKKKGSKNYGKRIKRLHKKLSEKDQEIEHWKREALSSRSAETPKSSQAQGSQTIEAIAEKPKAENFESHEDWIDALTDWKVEQKERAKEAKSKEAELKSEFQRSLETFKSRAQSLAKEIPDYSDVVDKDAWLSGGLVESVRNSEHGPRVLYEIMKKGELDRINSLPPIAIAREVGRIEARLENSQSSTQPQKPKTTKAPPPPKAINAISANVSKNPDTMDADEYREWRKAQRSKG